MKKYIYGDSIIASTEIEDGIREYLRNIGWRDSGIEETIENEYYNVYDLTDEEFGKFVFSTEVTVRGSGVDSYLTDIVKSGLQNCIDFAELGRYVIDNHDEIFRVGNHVIQIL